jgi:hypothetical protein
MRNLENDPCHLALRMPRKTGRLAQNASFSNRSKLPESFDRVSGADLPGLRRR